MRTIGTSDLKIHPLCLGGNPFGWTADARATSEILDAFVAGGGNFIDTADSYSAWIPGNVGGESETLIGEWMRTRKNRDSMVIATKVGDHPKAKGLSAKNIAAEAENSLRRLQTDRIDLYYAHRDDPSTPLEETVAAFDALVRAGRVRAVALSNYTAERAAEWFRIAEQGGHALPVALQPHYNLVARADYERNLAPFAQQHQLAVFPYFALASGFLTGKYRSESDTKDAARGAAAAQLLNAAGLGVLAALDEVAAAHGVSVTTVSLAWLLSRPTITAPIASVSRASQLPELLAAPQLTLSAAEVAKLDAASQSFA